MKVHLPSSAADQAIWHLALSRLASRHLKAGAGCPATETPFNGDHTAGIQALSTRQIIGDFGPLRRVP